MISSRAVKSSLKKVKSVFDRNFYAFPKTVQCNLCGWQGRRFVSDSWHRHINCPSCHSGIRQRLFVAALRNLDEFSMARFLNGRKVLHFAPEPVLGAILKGQAARYTTADFLRDDCDFSLDLSNMPQMENGSFDIVIAFDVLEHVPDYRKALEEVRRVLSPGGWGVFTVPQKDDLAQTFEDPAIVSPRDRTRHFGQWDHLRVFGNDFARRLASAGFEVTVVDESRFDPEQVRRNVLFPPFLSRHPLATNYRRVFFSRKHEGA
jgi:SAM-dependent methyltransferase